jgi:uncharacterized protein (DUF1697 family)
MAHLVELFEALELEDVTTFIASGNVVFRSRTKVALLEKQLDRHLQADLGYPAEAFLRTIPELRTILTAAAFDPAAVASSHALMIGFLRGPLLPDLATQVAALSGPTDHLKVIGKEIHWLRTQQESDPKLSKRLERTLTGAMTVRNINTVQRIVTKYGNNTA